MKRSLLFSIATSLATGVLVVTSPACDGKTLDPPPSVVTQPEGDAEVAPDTSTPEADAGVDTGAPAYDDGAPMRAACVGTLGAGLTASTHGRLDGVLVALVTAGSGSRGCPNDATHLHLQVRMQGDVYDIAVNLDGFEGEIDAPLPGLPFAEGWHPMDLDYVSAFNLHSTALTTTGETVILARLQKVLAAANHIAVFGTSYPGSDGAHLIHRDGFHQDGALVIDPGAPVAHVIAFRFEQDTF